MQFFLFAAVGTVGFVADSSLLYAFTSVLSIDPLSARLLSFLGAATFTWALNRKLTFKSRSKGISAEWARYVAATAIGGLINILVYRLWMGIAGTSALDLTLGVAAGSIVAMFFNFSLARKMVFRT